MRKVIDSEFPCLSHNSYRILNPYLTSRFRCYHSPLSDKMCASAGKGMVDQGKRMYQSYK